ncbi:MAG: hypothetical protein ACTS2F_11920 [Thainema sp.]
MTDPVTLTAAGIAALAASKFIEAAANKAAEIATPAVLNKAGSQIEALWTRIKQHFSGNKRAEAAIAQIEQEQSAAALTKLEVYLDDELSDPANQQFAEDVRQMAQQIINIGQQNQIQTRNTFNTTARDQSRVNNFGEFNANTVDFGDKRP